MLDDISNQVEPKHFIGRLNDKRFEVAIPAEAELGLVWATAKLGEFESEPDWFSEMGRKPEGISGELVPGYETVFDVKAISDRVMPSQVGMRKISRKFGEQANRIKKRSANALDYFFFERKDHRNPKNHRTVYAPVNYEPTDHAISLLREFLESEPEIGESVDIVDGEMAVRVTWKPDVFPQFNYRSSIVREVFDLSENHIAKALQEKVKQLKSQNFQGLRGVLLADVGCATLGRFEGMDPLRRSCSGRDIIQHFLDAPSRNLDFVCVFSAQEERSIMQSVNRYWQVSVCVRSGLNLPMNGLERLAEMLPKPNFTSYALEHLHEQRLFHEQSRGWYLGCNMTTENDGLRIKFSARALHEFLAGRIDGERLRDSLIKGTGAFEYQLRNGRTIQSAKIIPGGIDEDDDYIEFQFGADAAASAFSDEAEDE